MTETDTAGSLTIDHIRPQSRDGDDSPDNLAYCCHNCNQFKGDYWPQQPNDLPLWNPRQESRDTHFVELADGSLYSLTAVGTLTLRRLRLNRSFLIAYRLNKRDQREERRLLTRYRETITLLGQLYTEQATLMEDQHRLLEEQRRVLEILLPRNN